MIELLLFGSVLLWFFHGSVHLLVPHRTYRDFLCFEKYQSSAKSSIQLTMTEQTGHGKRGQQNIETHSLPAQSLQTWAQQLRSMPLRTTWWLRPTGECCDPRATFLTSKPQYDDELRCCGGHFLGLQPYKSMLIIFMPVDH